MRMVLVKQINKFVSKKLSVSEQHTDPRLPYFGSQSDKLTKEPSNLLSSFTSFYQFVIVQRNDFKIETNSIAKISSLSQCDCLLFISFDVRNAYASTWVAPRT